MMSKYPLLKSGTIVKLNSKVARMKIIKSNYTFVLEGVGTPGPDATRTNYMFFSCNRFLS
jgi:hypothetical protein